nr:methyltransferase-like protein 23 [Ciona intestinalis]|eukprot:XP_002124223.1 methyltransferase-like protein 23 [Ciona intestinalis]
MSSTSQCIESKKTFLFSDISNEDKSSESATLASQSVTTIEEIDAEYGSYTWPCAVVLAQYIWFHRKHIFNGKHVLELGAGTALPSILALMCTQPLSVTLTDKESYSRCFQVVQKSFKINKIGNVKDLTSDPPTTMQTTQQQFVNECPVYFMGLSWGQVSSKLVEMVSGCNEPTLPDVVIAADCFFEKSLFNDILSSVYFLLKSKSVEIEKNEKQGQNSKEGMFNKPVFLFTYQVRSRNWTIVAELEFWDLKCEQISLDTFNADVPNIAMSNMPGNHCIEMLVISLK